MKAPDILYKAESFEIMGACFDVYKAMGSGYLEAVYQECLQIELANRQIPFVPFARLPLIYRGVPLQQFYEADIVCYNRIILELKAAHRLDNQHRAQMLNYLKITGMKLGILLNFGHYPLLEYERIASDDQGISTTP
jgi:GxxExxY protein